MIDAVVFDLDGVLIDSEPVWEEVRGAFVAERGGRWPEDAQQRMMGMSTREWSTYVSEELAVGLSPAQVATEVIDRMAARYADHLPLLPGAVDAVRMTSARWPLGLASSSPARLIDAVLTAADIGPLFRTAMSSEVVDRGKPAPDVYLAVIRRLGVDPARCVAIEDSPEPGCTVSCSHDSRTDRDPVEPAHRRKHQSRAPARGV